MFKTLTKTIEKQYNSPIRLEKFKRIRKETPEEFLIQFFKKWNTNRDTIYVETKNIQTPKNKRRSLGDIYMIMKYYYPDITIYDVIQLLYVTLHKGELSDGFRSSHCRMIKKRVWYYDTNQGASIYGKSEKDEHGKIWRNYINALSRYKSQFESPEEDEPDEIDDYYEDDDE